MSDLLNKASLVMIPSGYKEDTVYSVVPTNGNGDLSFTRASNGTRINSAGLVEDCPWNIATYSEEFNNASWAKLNLTVTANDTTAPNGTITADKITSTNTTNTIQSSTTVVSGSIYTISVYAKNIDAGNIRIDMSNVAFGPVFTFATKTFSTVSGWTTSYEELPNGWFRLIATRLATSANASPQFGLNAVVGSVYIWGAQLNIGSTAKPYFPTTDRLNVPRLTYQNGGGGCPSLLLEKQSTNLALYSEQFDNAAWTKDGVTISANATTSPDGTQNADKIIGAASSGNKIIFQVNSITLGQPFTASAFFKKGEYKNAFLRVGGQTANPYVIYDLDTQSVVSTSGASSTQIESMGNGWYRISLTSLSATTTVIAPNVAFAPNSGYTISATNVLQYTGDGTSGGFAWGAQIEISSYKTSYIPTTSASATRVADACYKTGIGSLFGTNKGTFFWQGVTPYYVSGSGGAQYLWDISDTINFNLNRFALYTVGTNLVQLYTSVTGGNNATLAQNSFAKIALVWNGTNCSLYINGAVAISNQTIANSNPTAIHLNTRYSLNENGNAEVGEVVVFNTNLTNAELISLTTL